ncbi:hypothetical protein SH2C18_43730 [Clostridium sediminicola]|uniref:hypothetical protein n=1 Tax=Clostridium sediminicola TaxID=3114879 RepID=UPI0031F240AA
MDKLIKTMNKMSLIGQKDIDRAINYIASDSQRDCTIPFCCQINVPEGFVLEQDNLRISYNYNCLKILPETQRGTCIIDGERGRYESDATLFKLRVFGNIRYTVALTGVSAECNKKFIVATNSDNVTTYEHSEDANVNVLSTDGCIFVEKVVYEDCIEPSEVGEINDDTILVKNVKVIQEMYGNTGKRILNIIGDFVLDNPVWNT